MTTHLANIVAVAKDERFSNEYVGKLFRSMMAAWEETLIAPSAATSNVRKDAEEYGNALNEAAWKLMEVGGPGIHFNDLKAIARATILCYFDALERNTKTPIAASATRTSEEKPYLNCAAGTCQNTDGCIVTGCRARTGPLLAKVIRLDGSVGYGVVEATGRQFPFTFDCIKGYRGEYPKEIGLRVGVEVTVYLANDKVSLLMIGVRDDGEAKR
jgi:hypothetical protein